jgi:hypothetical protein
MAQQQSGSPKRYGKKEFKELRRRVKKLRRALNGIIVMAGLYKAADLKRMMKGRSYEKLSDFGVECDGVWDEINDNRKVKEAIENFGHHAKIECDSQDILSGIKVKPPTKKEALKRNKVALNAAPLSEKFVIEEPKKAGKKAGKK